VTYAADLHIHSSYARATSRELNFENLSRWAKIKGIDLLATGDFTHPAWFHEIGEKLNDTGDGLFELDGVKFVLGTELNCNAPQGGRSRRIHMLAFAPSLDVVERINKALALKSKSLESDGRPTLHMTPRELVATLMDIDQRCIIIPAHVWTPWFGMYGSKSGFDSLEECFGDTLAHITAIETGLSSDPAMCWQVPELDNLSIVSFSDAHSLPKLARELTVLNGEPSYDALADALRTQDIAYTVEFFPEEGKYHYSGHRKCGVSYSPEDVSTNGRTCPVCNRTMTLGVMQRVAEIGARDVATHRDEDGLTRADNGRPPFRSLIALQQVVSEALGFGVNTKRVQAAYTQLVNTFGTELNILLNTPTSDIADALPENGHRVAEGVSKVRSGDIYIEPGFDGQFGKVQVWPDEPAKSKKTSPSQSRMAL
jgi:uncharacterized protein (TIGR00375 family)